MKVAFFLQHLICGGVENSLISLVDVLIKKNCQVTVYVIDKRGEFIEKLPKQAELKEINLPVRIRKYLPVGGTKIAVRNKINDKKLFQAVVLIIKKISIKNKFAELNVDFDKIDSVKEKYDIAINYHMHSPFLVKFLSEKVTAERKYTWIHNDFTTTNYDIRALNKYLVCNNGFFAVSEQLKDEFLDLLPEYKDKTNIAHNIIDYDKILDAAKAEVPVEFLNCKSEITLLTCGRLESQKGYDLAIEVCKKMKDDGINFKWFVLGKGTEYKKLNKRVKKYKLQNHFIFLGVRLNPYTYFKNCDIYVQTSLHEGCAITLNEAKILCKPIICTDVAGVREQFIDGINADIVDINVDSIYNKLVRMINNSSRQKQYEKALKEQKYDSEYSFLKIFTSK